MNAASGYSPIGAAPLTKAGVQRAALLLVLAAACFFLGSSQAQVRAQETAATSFLVGEVRDSQNIPVAGAAVSLRAGATEPVLAETMTQEDGRYALPLPAALPVGEPLALHLGRDHFAERVVVLETAVVDRLQRNQTVALSPISLQRRISPAFWIAAAVFLGMLVAIALTELHNTLISLAAAMIILAVSYLGRPVYAPLFIFDFETALNYVDWDVIFLVMGMMMFVAIVERTGIFQWLAFTAYRLSGGRIWLLLTVLMLIAGVASAFLDNVTTMLLMTPISVQIALTLRLNPLTLLIPEVMASNVIGVSTLVGTPTNILIGSFGDISFNGFLTNLTPGVLMAFGGLVLYSLYSYRRDLGSSEGRSPEIVARLAERAQIDEPEHLRKAGWVGGLMLILFVFGERIHLVPAVTALLGATLLLLWIRPNVEEMIDAVDWTTLVFFISLFITVGAIQEVGLISRMAGLISRLVGDNLLVAMLVIVWFSAALSTVVANIPFTAAMLPVVGFLTATIPGAESKVLFFALSVGSAMGGNGSLIGASANLVTAGISERAGYPITYGYFLKKGLPALLVTVSLATLWLLLRFFIIGQ